MSNHSHAAAFAPPVHASGGRVPLIGMSITALTEALVAKGLPAFRARQVWQWLYGKGAKDFEEMSNLAKPLREQLAAEFSLERPEIITEQISKDGTRKWLLRMVDGQEIETVYIPDKDRGTLCVSSQVGCTLTCRFCHTGTMPLVRNLGASEIIAQIMIAKDRLNDWPATDPDRQLTNVVFMGMGEPLYNYDNVSAACQIMLDEQGLGLSRRRVTLSTSGVVPMMDKAGAELGVNLAISLHATRDDLRNDIVPINRRYPIKDLLDACKRYPRTHNARRITFEYVMLDGINDTLDDAVQLVNLLEGLPAKVNLIPFNPWPNAPFKCSSDSAIRAFSNILVDHGFATPVRRPRGQDILAACGQLKSASERLRKSPLAMRSEASVKV